MDGKDNVVIKFVRILNFHSNFSRNISDKWLRDLSIHAPDIKKNIDEKKNERINKVVEKLLEQGKKEKLIEDYLFAEREPLRDEVLELIEGEKPSLLQRKKLGDRILKRIMDFVETFINGMTA